MMSPHGRLTLEVCVRALQMVLNACKKYLDVQREAEDKARSEKLLTKQDRTE